MKKIILAIAALAATLPAIAEQTYVYTTRDGVELKLDHHRAENITGDRPCVIFAFGGAFAVGNRNDKEYLSYFKALNNAGYDVVSIDYRKVLASGLQAEGLKGAIGTMKKAVEYAAEDMLSATKFVLDNAEKWQIDRSAIIACGSSAGAITSLQAENMICNNHPATAELKDFNYAGVISFAGAIFSVSGKPKWEKEPCPIMLFHGNADSNVPYKKASAFGVGFYGSKFIYKQLKRKDLPYLFYSAEYRDHAMAGDPMYTNINDIIGFIKRYVVDGEKLQIVESVKDSKYPKVKTRFGVKDYLSTNYSK